jgi:hypothetical protein
MVVRRSLTGKDFDDFLKTLQASDIEHRDYYAAFLQYDAAGNAGLEHQTEKR